MELLLAAAVLVGIGAWRLARLRHALRGTRLVTCPENGRATAVELDVRYSAVRSAFGRCHVRLLDCSRWPARATCGQTCLGDLEAAPQDCLVPTVVARWFSGKRCAFCLSRFRELRSQDPAPALLDDQGITRAWNEIPPARLGDSLATQQPVCWNCHIVETFRRERPDVFADRRSPPMPPPF